MERRRRARADGQPGSPAVELLLGEVVHRCWAVTDVYEVGAGTGVFTASVGRRVVEVYATSAGAASTTVVLGFNGREVVTTLPEDGGVINLDFRASGSGSLLILFRDASGVVVAATGARVVPGMVGC